MGHIPEDSALMLRYKDGDTAAFETLYRRHNDALYRYLLRLCRHRRPRRTFSRMSGAKSSKPGRTTGPPQNSQPSCIGSRTTVSSIMFGATSVTRTTRIGARTARRSVGTPGYHRRAQPGQRATGARASRLPEEQRDAFLLHEEAGLNIDQIASVTGSNRETAKSRLRYAVGKASRGALRSRNDNERDKSKEGRARLEPYRDSAAETRRRALNQPVLEMAARMRSRRARTRCRGLDEAAGLGRDDRVEPRDRAAAHAGTDETAVDPMQPPTQQEEPF